LNSTNLALGLLLAICLAYVLWPVFRSSSFFRPRGVEGAHPADQAPLCAVSPTDASSTVACNRQAKPGNTRHDALKKAQAARQPGLVEGVNLAFERTVEAARTLMLGMSPSLVRLDTLFEHEIALLRHALVTAQAGNHFSAEWAAVLGMPAAQAQAGSDWGMGEEVEVAGSVGAPESTVKPKEPMLTALPVVDMGRELRFRRWPESLGGTAQLVVNAGLSTGSTPEDIRSMLTADAIRALELTPTEQLTQQLKDWAASNGKTGYVAQEGGFLHFVETKPGMSGSLVSEDRAARKATEGDFSQTAEETKRFEGELTSIPGIRLDCSSENVQYARAREADDKSVSQIGQKCEESRGFTGSVSQISQDEPVPAAEGPAC
jgi:hypothetical protein